jgi:hypothetical protein
MVIDVRPEQFWKTLSPILVTELGIITDVRPVQPENAFSPMLLTDSGIVTEISPEQAEKAEQAIPFVPSLMLTFVFDGIEPLYP